MQQQTCEERIDGMLERTIKDIRRVLRAKDKIEALNNYALALSKYELYKLELSWGGPQDYIEFLYDPESKELLKITYYFIDWFDSASRQIKCNSEEWKVLEELFYSCILIE